MLWQVLNHGYNCPKIYHPWNLAWALIDILLLSYRSSLQKIEKSNILHESQISNYLSIWQVDFFTPLDIRIVWCWVLNVANLFLLVILHKDVICHLFRIKNIIFSKCSGKSLNRDRNRPRFAIHGSTWALINILLLSCWINWQNIKKI